MLPGQIILSPRYLKLRSYLELSHDLGAGSRLVHTLCLEDSQVAGCSSELIRRGCSCCCCCSHVILSCCCYCCSCCFLGTLRCCCSPCCYTVGCCDSAGSDSTIVAENL